jgi:hypothetical protein
MDPSSSIRATHPTLLIRCTSVVPIVRTTEVKAARRSEDGGLLFDIGVVRGVGVKDGLEDAEKLRVLGEGVGGRWDGGGGADGKGLSWWGGWEEREDGFACI